MKKIIYKQSCANFLSPCLIGMAVVLTGLLTMNTASALIAANPRLPSYCDAAALSAFPEMPASLKCRKAPEPFMLNEAGEQVSIYTDIVKNKGSLIALGKMLFWDNQVGSDGIACASCHFHAGADNRVKNQINPGTRNESGELAPDGKTPIGNVFNYLPSTQYAIASPYVSDINDLVPATGKGPNYTLKLADFPLKKYKEPEYLGEDMPAQADRDAEIMFDTDDIVSSQGVYPSKYTSLNSAGRKEICEKKFPIQGMGMPYFNVAGHTVRQVAPRNTPSVINAVYNFRNFWDGRANNVFNGLDPFGMRRFAQPNLTPKAEIYMKNQNGALIPQRLAIYNSSLASQAVGPALSDVEMSCADKNFHELGRKMLNIRPLSMQKVDLSDSVLGVYAVTGKGLKPIFTYQKMIQAAFNDKYWNAPDTQLVDGYKLIENNFSLFWGLAIQAYEATLVSNDSRFDRALEKPADAATILTEQELRGFALFTGKGKCVACHSGPEFTGASVTHVENSFNIPNDGKYVERMIMGDGGIALYDAGFYNIGVRPTVEDIGVGAKDPYGFPLSFTRNAKRNAINPKDVDIMSDDLNLTNLAADPFMVDSNLMDAQAGCIHWNPETTVSGYLCGNGPIVKDEREAVDGSFKTPSIRNVELTGPYFHNGGQATLEQVVQFYNRGGDRKDMYQKTGEDCKQPKVNKDAYGNLVVAPDPETGLIDSTGFKPESGQSSNLDPDIAGSRDPFVSPCPTADDLVPEAEVFEPIDPEPDPLAALGLPKAQEANNLPSKTLNLTKVEVADLVAFMKSLTDERVRWEKAPFDHPSLVIPTGHVGDELSVGFNSTTNQANQEVVELPAVGLQGRQPYGFQALQPFESNLQ